MLRWVGHPNLCLFHARTELEQLESERLGTELAQILSPAIFLPPPTSTTLSAAPRPAPKIASLRDTGATLAYIGQLLLHSVNSVKSEFKFSYKFDQWNQMNQDAKPLSPPPSLSLALATQSANRDDHSSQRSDHPP